MSDSVFPFASLSPDDLSDAWINLAATGTPPATEIAGRVLPAWSVGLDDWLDRLASVYLRDYCRRNTHFKLAVGPYGAGKTHFLLALEARSTEENWATAYLQCRDISLGDWFGLYERIVRALQLPNSDRKGIRAVAHAALESMRAKAATAPDPEYTLTFLIEALEDEDWAHPAFARVMIALLQHLRDPLTDKLQGDAALRWLQGQPDTLTTKERQSLHLQVVKTNDRVEHGRTLLFSLSKFLRHAGVYGLALLLDEIDTIILSARGGALERALVSMRVMMDAPDARMGRVPLFGVLATVPDIAEKLQRYQALASRVSVVGDPFHKGNNNASQIDLSELGDQKEVLRAIGVKLLSLGMHVHNWHFDRQLQIENAVLLANITASRILEVNARRLFVKTWCGLLERQGAVGEMKYSAEELAKLVQGAFDGIRSADQIPNKCDIG